MIDKNKLKNIINFSIFSKRPDNLHNNLINLPLNKKAYFYT